MSPKCLLQTSTTSGSSSNQSMKLNFLDQKNMEGVKSHWIDWSKQRQNMVKQLISHGQIHLFENWLNVFHHHFGNTKLSRVYVPSFDCSWNFSSSINH